MRMAMFSGAVVVFLCAHTVFGFGMLDFLRAARQEEAHHFRRSLTVSHVFGNIMKMFFTFPHNLLNLKQPPANAIVEVIQGAFDSDENGKVSLAEVGAFLDRYFNPGNEQPFTPRHGQIEGKAYLVTLASIIDTNGDGNLTTAELIRAAEILVNNAGNKQIGRMIEMRIIFTERMPSYSLQAEARKAINVFMEVTDSNRDGEIRQDEVGIFFALRRYRWFIEYGLSSDFEEADGNSDGKLNRTEATEFLTNLSSWALKRVLVYLEICQRVGKEIADEFVNTEP